MRAACLLLLLPFTSGCNYVLVSGGTLYVSTGPAVASMATVGALVANVDARNDFSAGVTPNSNGPAPEMLGERAVAERDCTKPIEDWSANLKCR